MENVKRLKEKGLIGKETAMKAKQELKKGKPYISCHNPSCDGLLREIDKKSIKPNMKTD